MTLSRKINELKKYVQFQLYTVHDTFALQLLKKKYVQMIQMLRVSGKTAEKIWLDYLRKHLHGVRTGMEFKED